MTLQQYSTNKEPVYEGQIGLCYRGYGQDGHGINNKISEK